MAASIKTTVSWVVAPFVVVKIDQLFALTIAAIITSETSVNF
jgi:hypothetical protein